MNEFSTYEYVVQRKNRGSQKLKPMFFIIGYIVFALLALTFAVRSKLGAPLVALAPVALLLIIFLTWRYTKIEYEYSITSGVLTFSEIYGGKSRKVIAEFRIKDCSVIAPLSDPDKRELADRYNAEISYIALSEKDAPDGYFALFENEKGKRCIFFFEATEKALKICRFYNPANTTVTKVSL